MGEELDQFLDDVAFGMASRDFYMPLLEAGLESRRYQPQLDMSGWVNSRHDIWLGWKPPRTVESLESGWKVHVSGTIQDSHETLDVVAGICVNLGIPFKHTYDEFCFIWLHHKYASRAQSGKFVTIYPPDAAASGELMDRLEVGLGPREAPYVLSDRRFGSSRAIHYRYGAHREVVRFDPATGAKIRMFRDRNGVLKADERHPKFLLPIGIDDPFRHKFRPAECQRSSELFENYTFEEAIRHSNGGGAYSATDRRSGSRVFIKEARAHTGLTWDRLTAKDRLRKEFRIIKQLNGADPGICPRPLAHLSEWEHEYLVTEWIEGITLHRWVLDNMPLIRFEPDLDESANYYTKCLDILEQLSELVARVRALGMRFGDLNPNNVLLDADGVARLIDFEAATSLDEEPARMGTPGFVPVDRPVGDRVDIDDYALSAIARFMLYPVFDLMERNPAFWSAARRDARLVVRIPEELWQAAGRYVAPASWPNSDADVPAARSSSTADFAGDAEAWANELTCGIGAAFDPDGEHWRFPPSYQGIRSNTVCFAYGTAGVLGTLALRGRDVSEAHVDLLVRDAELGAEGYDDSLFFGSAGIAATLAGFGRLEEAQRVLRAGPEAPGALPGSLATGSTGRGLVYLDLYCRTGDVEWLRRSEVLADISVKAARENAEVLHDSSRLGLMYGHTGVALFLHAIWAVTKDEAYRQAGRVLLHRDLLARMPMDDGSISISDRVDGRRAMPYLSEGSAGVGTVALLYAAGEEKGGLIADSLPGFERDAFKLFTYNAGLYSGLAGLLLFQNELRSRGGSRPDRLQTIGRALEKYLVPRGDHYMVLGDGGTRFSADVWSGSAGVIRALDSVIHGPAHQYLPLMRGGLLVPWLEADQISKRRG
ncbi:class III lanthionine synthetase LanKC [Nocardia sp. NPDC003345]